MRKSGLWSGFKTFLSTTSNLLTRKRIFGLGLCLITMTSLGSADFESDFRTPADWETDQLSTPSGIAKTLPNGCKSPPEKLLGAELIDADRAADSLILAYSITNQSMEVTTRFVVEITCAGELTMLLAQSMPMGLDTDKIPPRGDK